MEKFKTTRKGWGLIQWVVVLGSLMPLYFAAAYMDTYGRHSPYADQWHYSADLAVKTHEGTLTAADVLAAYNGHRYLATNSVTIFVTLLNGWDARTEMVINWVLLLINLGLMTALFWQQNRAAVFGVLIPFAALLFLLPQDPNLLVGFQSSWHFVVTFLLAGLCLIQFTTPSWRALIGAVFFSVLATFSFGNGALVWFVLPAALWLRGYRRPFYYVFWIALALICFAVYLTDSGIRVESSESTTADSLQTVELSNPLDLVKFTLVFLGAPLAYENEKAALALGGSGILFLLLNLAYLWRTDREKLGVWLAMAGYAGGSAVLIGLTRTSSPQIALLTRYLTASIPLWVALVALMALVLWRQLPPSENPLSNQLQQAGEGNESSPRLRDAGQWLVKANMLFSVVMVLFFFRSTFFSLQMIALRQGYPLENQFAGEYYREDGCVLNYPLTQNDTCLETYRLDGGHIPERILRLAAYQLNIFVNQTPEKVLPDSYQPGSPIIIQTASLWLNVYIRDWMLKGIDEADIYHLAPDGEIFSVNSLPHPPQNVITEISSLPTTAQIWYIRTPEMLPDTIIQPLQEKGYFGTPLVLQQGRYSQSNFTIVRYQQPPDHLETLYAFGEENIQLLAWSVDVENPGACNELRVQSWWQSEAVPLFNYSASLSIYNAAGRRIAQNDAAIADIPMQLWLPDQLYFEERVLTMPCDLPPGEYYLALALYHQADGNFINLPIMAADGDPEGELVTLRAFSIGE